MKNKGSAKKSKCGNSDLQARKEVFERVKEMLKNRQ